MFHLNFHHFHQYYLKNNQTHSENFYELNLFVNLSESFRLKLYDVFINYIEWNDARIKRFKYI